MKIAIIDDSRLARLELKNQLAAQADFECVGEAASVAEALSLLAQEPVDLLLLDIHLPDGDGFDLLSQLTFVPKVIFVTAYDHYAIKSFEFNALDYLLKPVKAERLYQALKKAKEQEEQPAPLSSDQKIFIKDGDNCYFVALKEIRAFEAMGNYTRIHLKGSQPSIYRSMRAIEARLGAGFFRASRGWIINTDYISTMTPLLNGSYEVRLDQNLKVILSKRQAIEFRRLWAI